MSIGRYISIEESRKHNKLDRFIKEHPSNGNVRAFDILLDNMAFKKKPKVGKTLKKV